MAKYVANPVGTGFGAQSNLNQNFEDIEDNFQRVLYRDGSSPNQMEAILDMNGNRIINLPNAASASEPVTYAQWASGGQVVTFTGTTREEQVATAGQTVFTLLQAYTPGSSNLSVYINGVCQHPSAFVETDANTVTFSEGLAEGQQVLFVINERQVDTDVVPASSVTYTSPVNGATSVNSELNYLNKLTVATVDAMKALTGLSDGARIKTSGFEAVGDGGHGEYLYYSTPPATEENVIYHNQTTGGGQFKLLVENGELNALAGGVATAPTNSSTAVLACITAANANGLKLVFPGLSFKFTVVSTVPCEIECRPGFSVEPAAAGDVSVLRFNGVASGTNYQMTGAAARFDRSLTTTVSASDLTAGNLFVLQDNTTRASDGAVEINMEVHRASSVAGATINLVDYVREAKTATSTNIYKITPCSGITIRGWNYTSVSGSIANTGLFFDMCENVHVYGVRGRSFSSEGVSFRRCFDVAVYDWDFAAPLATSSGQGYGLAFSKGTSKIHVGRGIGVGLRHTVDFDSCYDVSSDTVHSIGATSGDVMFTHNGWGGDFKNFDLIARGGLAQAGYVSLPATAGATAYTKSVENLHANIDAQLINAAGGTGFQSEQPLIDSDVRVRSVHGIGEKPTAFVSNVYGVRIPADKSKGTRVFVNSIGASSAVFRNTGSAGFGDARFYVTARNCFHAFFAQDSTEVNIEELDADNIHDQVLKYDGAATLRKISVGTGHLKNLNSTVTNIPAARQSASGVVGRFGPVYNDQSDVALALGAGFTITIDQLLKAANGQTILVTAAGAVSSAATAFEQGFYNGQRLTLVTDQTANTITILHSTQVQNDGSASVVLGSAKRSATWEYSTAIGRWYQVA